MHDRTPTRALILLACLLPVLALAHSKQSATHVMQWVEGETIHIANQEGAINRHGDVKVEVEVFSSQQVIVTDSGKRSEHNLYRDYSTDDTTTWRNIWRGTFHLTGDTMRLDLLLHERTCTHQKTWSDAAPETLPCGEVSKQVRFACKLGKVTTADPASPVRATVPVWTCSPTAPAELADTPSPWVLGKASCVQVLAGRRGPSYRKCS